MARVFIALGSNVGDRREHLAAAAAALAALPATELVCASGVYETDPVGPIPQGAYLNAAVELRTSLIPTELLGRLQAIERHSGRLDASQRQKWGPRTLDLDILLYDDMVRQEGDPLVPHPRLHERWFVLRPLADVAGDVLHPVLKLTIGELLRRVKATTDQEPGRRIDFDLMQVRKP